MGSDELEPSNSMGNLYFFILIAMFILSLACINYINLATARSSKRAKEVGLRKVVGAKKSQLIRQFLGESMLFSILAFPVALLLAEFLLPAFNRIVGRELSLLSLNNFWVLVVLFGVAVGVGAVSGSYPAFLISSYHPVRIIRGFSSSRSSKSLTRNILVVVQFAISIAFIFVTVVTKQQLSFIQGKNAGFNKEHVVVVPVKDLESTQSYPIFKNELLENPDILYVTASRQLPSNIRFKHLVNVDGNIADEEIRMDWNGVDFDFLETYGMEVVEGRNFDRSQSSDAASAYILNETAVKRLGWTSPLGKKFQLSNEGLARAEFTAGEIIGVVKDFHFQSFHNYIEPLVLKIRPGGVNFVSARIKSENVSGALSFIKSKWEMINPTRPFEYFFFDDHFNSMYRTEADLQNVFQYSSILAILIASLGVFGLASFKVEQRTKEIGIRKILGASASNIILLLSRDFARLVLIANVIAWPVGYFVMYRWLQDYAYRIGIGWQAFIFSVMLALAVALLAVSYQSIRAAVANPANALRYE
jgi:putative ABC transport system permease protein